jgi:hypothetical protein
VLARRVGVSVYIDVLAEREVSRCLFDDRTFC